MTDSIDGLMDSRRFTGRMLWMATSVGFLLAAALVISLVRVSDEGSEPPKVAVRGAAGSATEAPSTPDGSVAAARPPRDASRAADRGPAEIVISLRLTPKDAEVRVDGKLVRKREFKLPRSEKKHQLEVKAPGFQVFSRRFIADSSTVLVVALDRADAGPPDAGLAPDLARPPRRADARVRRAPRSTPTPKRPKRLGDGLPEL